MKKVLTFLVVLVSFTSSSLHAQNITVSGALAGNGSYPTLEAAFTAINGGTQTAANIVVSVTGSTTETNTAVLNAGAWSQITITPGGGAARTISGSIAGPLISFNGADNVLINGLDAGGNSLTLENTSTATTASTIQFINDATIISVINCTIKGASTSDASGTVLISTGTATGNDSISISNCVINESGANLPVNAIASIGSAGAGLENSSVAINNCSISNFFSASLPSAGILATTGNTGWTVSNNRIFQSATRTYTTGNTHRGIRIASGDDHRITGNILGYATSSASGTYTMNSTVATRFIAIDLAVGTVAASSVQGNSISNFLLTTSSGASTANGIFCGINVTSGNVNIGNIASNNIGSTSGINAIVANSTTSSGMVVGINTSSSGTILISQNIIGALTSTGITATVSGNVTGINVSGVAASLTVSSNVIGNTTADNLRGGTLGLTTGSSLVVGINLPSTPTGTSLITNNTIRNLASYGTGTTGAARGIQTAAASGNPNTLNITSNTITNLVSNSPNTTIANGQASVAGICLSTGTNCVASDNTISNLSNINTGTGQTYVIGIGHGNATNSLITRNRIYDLSNSGTSVGTTSPSIIAGVVIRSGTTAVTVSNNMISLGTGISNNNAIVGIMGNHGSTPDPTDRIYHNTINITGTVTSGAQPSIGIGRTDFGTTARTVTMDIRNNIVTNSRSGGTGIHCAIANNYGAATSSATGWGSNASNFNILNANAASVGYWSSTAVSFTDWKTASNSDANSFSSITVNYVNAANDLHLNMGTTPTVLESNAQTIAAVTVDFDNQNRPGPAGSVNGGAFGPDFGADEFDGVSLDLSNPVITYTPLSFTCVTTDRAITATISDFSGVPTGGALSPRIYFRKNANAYVSAAGVLTSGTAQNGTWTFTIASAAMGGLTFGDVVSYFIVAQDNSPAANITANPSTGFAATDVNNVTSFPTTPNTYNVSAVLSGPYTVGTGGNYSTITAAVNAYNTSCISGAVTFILTDATYPSETFPITIQANPFASAVNTLTIQPAIGVSATIDGSSAQAIFVLNGADFVTINGSNGNVANSVCPKVTATRDLTISNTNTSTASAVVSLQTTAGGDAAVNNRILNCIISGASGTTTGTVVNISGPTIGSGAGAAANNNNSIVNNLIRRGQVGIFSAGNANAVIKNRNNYFALNEMNATTTDALGRIGIMVLYEDSTVVLANTVANINNSSSQDVVGIAIGSNTVSNTLTVGSEVTNSIVDGNLISDLNQTNTFSCVGIVVAATSSGTTKVQNNIVNKVMCNGTAGDFAGGLFYGGGAGTFQAYHNTLVVDGPALTGASQPNIGLAINGSTPNVDIRNNIILCAGSNGFNGNTGIGLGYTSTVGNYANLISNYNDIFVSGTNAVFSRVGSLVAGTTQANLAAWQAETGRDANSVNVLPTFVAANDLHLVAGNNALLEDVAPPVSTTTDFDCQARNACAVDLGADEFGTPREITLSGNNNVIASGDTTPDVNDFTVFDSTSVCSGTTSRTFEIKNLGTTDLTVTNVTISGANAAEFTLGNVPSGALTSSSSVTFTISFDPSAAGLRKALVTVSSNDCDEASYTFAIEGLGSQVIASIASQTNVNCNGDATGAATAAASGGISPYTYAWSNGANTSSASNLVAGTYSVTVTDSNGCTATSSVIISQNPALANSFSSVADVSCNGGSNGQATAVTSGGFGSYSYNWSSGASTATAGNLAAGNYALTITDGVGCVLLDTVDISEPAVLIGSIGSQTNVNCNGDATGAATAAATGGISPYTYAWSNGANTISASNLVAGSYSVTITDSNGCTAGASATITENPALSNTFTSVTNVSCNGGNNGEATAVGAGGFGTYSYNWSSGATSASASNLSAGNYALTITDGVGCTLLDTITITEPSALATSVAAQTNVSCNGDATGSATVSATGGTSPYSFNWSSGGTDSTETALDANTYSVVVSDALGCSATQQVIITEPSALSASVALVTADSSCTVDNGAVDISVAGGTTSYSFAWSNAATSEDISGVGAGTYVCVVTDALGCVDSVTATVAAPVNPTVSFSLPQSVICDNASPISLSASPAGGTFSGSGVSGTSFNPAGLSGNVSIAYAYTDATTGCSATASDTLQVDVCSGITANGKDRAVAVYPNPFNGFFTISLSDVPAEPLQIDIINSLGQTIESFSMNATTQQVDCTAYPSGFYTIRFTDANGIFTKTVIKSE